MSKWMVSNQKKHDTVRTTGATFKWGVTESKDFEKLCPNYTFISESNLTEYMKKYAPITMRIIAPFLKNRNNRIAKFEIKQ